MERHPRCSPRRPDCATSRKQGSLSGIMQAATRSRHSHAAGAEAHQGLNGAEALQAVARGAELVLYWECFPAARSGLSHMQTLGMLCAGATGSVPVATDAPGAHTQACSCCQCIALIAGKCIAVPCYPRCILHSPAGHSRPFKQQKGLQRRMAQQQPAWKQQQHLAVARLALRTCSHVSAIASV